MRRTRRAVSWLMTKCPVFRGPCPIDRIGFVELKSLGSTPAAHEHWKFLHARGKGRELLEGKCVRAIGKSCSGIVVCFEEEAVNACGHGSTCERLDEFRLAPACVALSAGQLHRVSRVENYWIAEFLHLRNTAKIDDQILI